MLRSSPHSWWGIKNSGDDISVPMMDIIANADQFIVVGGYNFTFKSSAGARPFFDALVNKLRAGVRVLMIFPPYLNSRSNPQPAIIDFCLKNGIAVILNRRNHSKWLLTEAQMYYGSGNFTNTSWLEKVEVISLHDHANINHRWSRDTVRDFYNFIRSEMAALQTSTRGMQTYRGLLTLTRNSWTSIRPLVLRLNPSAEKVKQTLYNYDKVTDLLLQPLEIWFDHYDKEYFDLVFTLSSSIAIAIDELCEYAYAHIYNETAESDNIDVAQRTINVYNTLYENATKRIEAALQRLTDDSNDEVVQSNLSLKNLTLLSEVENLLRENLGPSLEY